jgi:hypothetical protein
MKFNVLSDLNVQICSPRTAAGALCALVIATATLLHSPYAVAEFYARQDHLGRKHLSNLPPSGFNRNGEIRQAYNPNSIVYQHAKMLEALAVENATITEASELEAREADNRRISLQARQSPTARRGPREGNMNLEELIALDKRGGRWQGDVERRP